MSFFFVIFITTTYSANVPLSIYIFHKLFSLQHEKALPNEVIYFFFLCVYDVFDSKQNLKTPRCSWRELLTLFIFMGWSSSKFNFHTYMLKMYEILGWKKGWWQLIVRIYFFSHKIYILLRDFFTQTFRFISFLVYITSLFEWERAHHTRDHIFTRDKIIFHNRMRSTLLGIHGRCDINCVNIYFRGLFSHMPCVGGCKLVYIYAKHGVTSFYSLSIS